MSGSGNETGSGNVTGREIGSGNVTGSENGTGRGIEIGKGTESETERRVAPSVMWNMHLSGDQVCFEFLPFV